MCKVEEVEIDCSKPNWISRKLWFWFWKIYSFSPLLIFHHHFPHPEYWHFSKNYPWFYYDLLIVSNKVFESAVLSVYSRSAMNHMVHLVATTHRQTFEIVAFLLLKLFCLEYFIKKIWSLLIVFLIDRWIPSDFPKTTQWWWVKNYIISFWLLL